MTTRIDEALRLLEENKYNLENFIESESILKVARLMLEYKDIRTVAKKAHLTTKTVYNYLADPNKKGSIYSTLTRKKVISLKKNTNNNNPVNGKYRIQIKELLKEKPTFINILKEEEQDILEMFIKGEKSYKIISKEFKCSEDRIKGILYENKSSILNRLMAYKEETKEDLILKVLGDSYKHMNWIVLKDYSLLDGAAFRKKYSMDRQTFDDFLRTEYKDQILTLVSQSCLTCCKGFTLDDIKDTLKYRLKYSTYNL